MKAKKSHLSKLIIWLILIVGVPALAAAGGGQQSVPSKPAAAPAASAAPAATGYVLPAPMTVTGLGFISTLYIDVTDYNQTPGIQNFSKTTGLNFDWTFTNPQNQTEQINLSFASRKMPDVYTHLSKVTAMQYGDQGALVDLMPYIKKDAPNIMKALQADPLTLPMFTTADGKLYGIPQIDSDYRLSTFKIFVAQQQWLNKLNLKAPTTTDELYTVLKAFKDNAAQLTPNPIIPYSSYFSGNMEGWFSVFGWAFDLGSPTAYSSNGKLVFGALQPQFKDTINYVRKLFAEGLIDQDLVAVKDDATYEAKMTNNRVGIAYVGQGRFGTYNQKAASVFPGFDIEPMIPIKNASGQVQYNGVGATAHPDICMAVSVTCKDPESVVKAWDWFFSPEGQTAMNLGVLGDTYQIVNGQVQYTDKIMKDPKVNANSTLLRYISPLYDFPCARIYDFERAQLGPQLAAWKDTMLKGGSLNGVTAFTLNNLPVTPDQLQTYGPIETDLQTYMNESITKFIQGTWTIDKDYDAFVTQLKAMKVDDYMNVLNQSFAKLSASK